MKIEYSEKNFSISNYRIDLISFLKTVAEPYKPGIISDIQNNRNLFRSLVSTGGMITIFYEGNDSVFQKMLEHQNNPDTDYGFGHFYKCNIMILEIDLLDCHISNIDNNRISMHYDYAMVPKEYFKILVLSGDIE